MKRIAAKVVMLVAEVLGGGSLILFAAFLFVGPVVSVRLDFSPATALYWDALLSLVFFAQHSLMVRARFKGWLARVVARDLHAAVYAIASGAVLAAVMLFWQSSPTMVAVLSEPGRWMLRAAAILAVAGFGWGIHSLRIFDPFGRRPITARLRGEVSPPTPLVRRGPFLWVRHPLYFFMLILIWAVPDVSLDRALFNMLWTIWIVIGTHLEERDLVAEFGERYRHYQHVVPMLLPWRGPAGKALALAG